MKRVALASFLVCAAVAGAHPAPNSMLRLEFAANAVRAEYWLPVSELQHARAADPGGEIAAYLLRHVGAETRDGRRWRVVVEAVRETDYLDHPYLVAELTMAPPAGAQAGEFVLVDDTVTHEVRNHVVYVVTPRGPGFDLIGALQYPARRLQVSAR